MITTMRGVVLRSIAYSDKSNIVTLYTDLWGSAAFVLPVRQQNNRSKGWVKLFQPLRCIELTTPSRSEQPIKLIRRAQLARGVMPLSQMPLCSAYFLYLSQLLYQLLHEEPADDRLFGLLDRAIEMLDDLSAPEELNGFDLALMADMLRIKGYFPDQIPSYALEGNDLWFDIERVAITSFKPATGCRLTKTLQAALPRLLQVGLSDYRQASLDVSAIGELRALLLSYAEVHTPSFHSDRVLPIPPAL